jgi:hypothetical protein
MKIKVIGRTRSSSGSVERRSKKYLSEISNIINKFNEIPSSPNLS